jgi:hypothetical protein
MKQTTNENQTTVNMFNFENSINMNMNMNMNMNINIDLVENHQKEIYKPYKPNKTNKQVIRLESFLLTNEIDISKDIKQIGEYNKHPHTRFDIIITHKNVQLGKINKYANNALEHLKTDKKHVLCEYTGSKRMKFDEFMAIQPTPKLFIFHVLDTYSYLLDSLLLLNDNAICFYNLSAANIGIAANFKPVLQNFNMGFTPLRIFNAQSASSSSLITAPEGGVLNERRCNFPESSLTKITQIISNTTDYTHKPFEVHVLFYLIIKQHETLTDIMIERICNVFVQNTTAIEYKDDCVEFLQQYKGKPRNAIIGDLLKYANTWDNYSCSVIYLHIVSNMIRVFNIKNRFFTEFVNILKNNLNPNPTKRASLKQTIASYQQLYHDYKDDWNFVSAIQTHKIAELHESLSK